MKRNGGKSLECTEKRPPWCVAFSCKSADNEELKKPVVHGERLELIATVLRVLPVRPSVCPSVAYCLLTRKQKGVEKKTEKPVGLAVWTFGVYTRRPIGFSIFSSSHHDSFSVHEVHTITSRLQAVRDSAKLFNNILA